LELLRASIELGIWVISNKDFSLLNFKKIGNEMRIKKKKIVKIINNNNFLIDCIRYI
jgi:hypothetical protein